MTRTPRPSPVTSTTISSPSGLVVPCRDWLQRAVRDCTRSKHVDMQYLAKSGAAQPPTFGPNGRSRATRPGDDVPHWALFFDEAQLADDFVHTHRDLPQCRAAAQPRGTLPAIARPRVGSQPPALPSRPCLSPPRPRRTRSGLSAPRRSGRTGSGDAVCAGGRIRPGLRTEAGTVPRRRCSTPW